MNVIISNKYQEMLAGLNIDIIKSMNGEFAVDEIISTFSNFFFNRMILDITAISDYKDFSNIQKLSMGLDMSKIILLLDDSAESSTTGYLSKLISMGIYNFTKSVDNIKFLIDNPNTYKDVAHYHQITEETNNLAVNDLGGHSGTIIIGIKNVTDHAGATSLIYMMKKQLSRNYSTLAIEVNRNDFVYFNDNELISVSQDELGRALLRGTNAEVVLIDLNDCANEGSGVCTDIIYLIEPSTIKLNKMIRRNRGIFDKLKNQKIVLNKSLLENKDVMDFEYESKSQVFFNVPPLDDKINRHRILDDFLSKLGFIRQKEGESTDDGSILKGIFKGKN